VRDLEELNLLLRAASKEEENRVIAGRAQSIGAAMLTERGAFQRVGGASRGGTRPTYPI